MQRIGAEGDRTRREERAGTDIGEPVDAQVHPRARHGNGQRDGNDEQQCSYWSRSPRMIRL